MDIFLIGILSYDKYVNYINDQLQEDVMDDEWNAIQNFDWVHKNGQWSIGFTIGDNLSNKHRNIIIDIVGKVFGGDIDREDIEDEKFGNIVVNIPEYFVQNKSSLKKFKELIVKKF